MWIVYAFMYYLYLFVFFFKQKTAYEMRISDWSSDVCSSDLLRIERALHILEIAVGNRPDRDHRGRRHDAERYRGAAVRRTVDVGDPRRGRPELGEQGNMNAGERRRDPRVHLQPDLQIGRAHV